MLERARIVDTTNHWAYGTMKAYTSKFNVIQAFETDFSVSVLPHTPLLHPPCGPSIRLMWAQERYSLYPARWRRHSPGVESSVKFATVRGLRSAASHHWIWDLLHVQPAQLTLGFRDKPTVVTGCSPTDELAYTIFTDGMKRRLGDSSQPSVALLDQHVTWMNDHFESVYRSAGDDLTLQRSTCRAASANLLAWLGWLRAVENSSVTWGDTVVTRPQRGPELGLLLGMGAVAMDLLPQTKSNQTATADVVIAYTTASGKSLGLWLDRLWAACPPAARLPSAYVLCHDSGIPWTSHYFRYTFVYPLLSVMRSLGDPFLQKFDESPGKGLAENFWSFNMYRRGGRGMVSRKRPGNTRAATPAETVEHGCWRISRSSLDMPTAYLEWSVADRVCITFFCM
jgi:hypothetical protein